MDNDGRAIVGDFGLARRITSDTSKQPFNAATPPGTLRHLAPECFNGPLTVKSDVWAMGIFVWEIYFPDESPFEHISDAALRDRLRSGSRPERWDDPSVVPEIATLLMDQCWALQPNDRPTFRQIIATWGVLQKTSTECLQDGADALTVLGTCDPSMLPRLSDVAVELLQV